uniref:Uncharacterized protein n=1 Tax=Chlamydomonas leiostraca TaxID=1034604 RepID=A0A7S0X0W9_9CHLO|mmetsp:Transcript_6642/g.16500  ORF Transcript_6642/g.16500 Transcript_6642/m.16500 type:complete len:213 (+) Transcript_6642:194-832(+)
MQTSTGGGEHVDHTFKILLIGDSSVGKSSLLTRFTSGSYSEQTPATIGVDFAVKYVTLDVGDGYTKRIKLLLWDTAGQEKFRTLTSTFYRGAKGVILVYDVTREATLRSLDEYWLPEASAYASAMEPVKMVVANKTDLGTQRQVSTQEGHDFARRHGCLFVETSAKANVAVGQAFEELLLKILETPGLLDAPGAGGVKLNQAARAQDSACYC